MTLILDFAGKVGGRHGGRLSTRGHAKSVASAFIPRRAGWRAIGEVEQFFLQKIEGRAFAVPKWLRLRRRVPPRPSELNFFTASKATDWQSGTPTDIGEIIDAYLPQPPGVPEGASLYGIHYFRKIADVNYTKDRTLSRGPAPRRWTTSKGNTRKEI
ncbi:MAG: hypothetical protein HYV35_04160 [Lentisphaerae bacterium]|nr:hypothetical protein [Lentisphaerota bacterium]